MDLQLGQTSNNAFYLVVGCRVGILLNKSRFADPQSGYLSGSWLRPSITADEREAAFGAERTVGIPARMRSNSKVKDLLVLTSPRCQAIIGLLDILVDIGVPAEKEVIQ